MAQTLLAFDYGLAHIGVATGQSLTGSANPLTVLKARDGVPDWQQVEKLLKEWQPDLCLVGQPLNMDGSESEMSQRAAKFARRLEGRFQAKVELVDERLSSFEAKGELLADGGSREFRDQGVDAIAARLIIESWLSRQPPV